MPELVEVAGIFLLVAGASALVGAAALVSVALAVAVAGGFLLFAGAVLVTIANRSVAEADRT